MRKETITYTDFNGEERTENFYFNLTEAELVEMDMTTVGGMREMLSRIIQEKDNSRIIKEMKKIIALSYGKKSDDGRRLIKNDAVLDDFRETNAYSQLFMRLATDDVFAAEFINDVIPESVKNRNAAAKDAEQANVEALPEAEVVRI